MGRSLDALQEPFRGRAILFLARCIERGLPVLITCTDRTAAEQATAVATGHSQVAHSKHEDGLAMDVVPYVMFKLHGEDKLQYDTADPVWREVVGDIAEGIPGIRWGGRFRHPPLGQVAKPARDLLPSELGWDPGHIEEQS